MKIIRGKNLSIFKSIGLLALFPSVAFALAGIAEHYSTFYYNQYAKILWAHPGDICTRDSEASDLYCFQFIKDNRGRFRGLEDSMEEINTPLDGSSPYIIVRRSIDNKWLVYNLEKEEYLTEETGITAALDVWKFLKLKEPKFIDSKNPEKFLSETVESKKSRLVNHLFVWAAFGLGPALIMLAFFGIFTYTLDRKFKNGGSKAYLILSRLLMVPTGLIALFVLLSIGIIVVLRVFYLI